jgi:tryptophanyl-tRNA synthetase
MNGVMQYSVSSHDLTTRGCLEHVKRETAEQWLAMGFDIRRIIFVGQYCGERQQTDMLVICHVNRYSLGYRKLRAAFAIRFQGAST